MRVALLLGLMLVAPATALAQAPAGDSVTGTAASGEARSHVTYTFDVHSGAEGENPTGTVTLDTFFGVIGPLRVGCLSVTGNRAGMIALAPPGSTNVAGLAISVQDGGPGQDQIDFTTLTELPDGCPPPSAPGSPTDSGDVVVTDSPPPPTVYARCRQAGWVKYGFDSRAACNAYVTTWRAGDASSSGSPTGSWRSERSTGSARTRITRCATACGSTPAGSRRRARPWL